MIFQALVLEMVPSLPPPNAPLPSAGRRAVVRKTQDSAPLLPTRRVSAQLTPLSHGCGICVIVETAEASRAGQRGRLVLEVGDVFLQTVGRA